MMSILFIFVLTIIFVPLVFTQEGIKNVCEFTGDYGQNRTNFKFLVNDLPERCDVVLYGNYLITGDYVEESRLYKNDEDAIRSLVGANKKVFSYVAYPEDEPWYEFFEPKDLALYNERVCRLIQTIKDFSLSGIILGVSDLYVGTADYANKIGEFIKKLKKEVPTLKFGLPVDGTGTYEKIQNKDLFDFSILNSLVEIYMIKTYTMTESCTQEALKTGTLITSTDPNALTLEKIGNAVKNSAMDKNKTFAKPVIIVQKDSNGTVTPYSQYCAKANADAACSWCAENSQKFYDIGVFLKKYYHGLSMAWLDYDDFEGLCECQKYPVTNILFDGWDGVPLKPCPKLDIK